MAVIEPHGHLTWRYVEKHKIEDLKRNIVRESESAVLTWQRPMVETSVPSEQVIEGDCLVIERRSPMILK